MLPIAISILFFSIQQCILLFIYFVNCNISICLPTYLSPQISVLYPSSVCAYGCMCQSILTTFNLSFFHLVIHHCAWSSACFHLSFFVTTIMSMGFSDSLYSTLMSRSLSLSLALYPLHSFAPKSLSLSILLFHCFCLSGLSLSDFVSARLSVCLSVSLRS